MPGPSYDYVRSELARRHHLDFVQYLWQRPRTPFLVGRHTHAICDRIDRAIVDFRNGQSTYLAIKVPFRHGKSDLFPRYLPPRFLGLFPDHEVLVTAYTASLVRSFSRFSRGIMRDPRYSMVFPHITLSADDQSVDSWGVHEAEATGQDLGRAQWMGLLGSVTGKGGSLVIVDDFFKNREEAESETMRDKVWEALTNDVMTRLAPVAIFVILATPWHVDDPFGRIASAMEQDDAFPRFEELKFPAFDTDGTLGYTDGVLFPERFSRTWYTNRRAILGPYATAGLMQCDPILRSGNLFNCDHIDYYDELPPDVALSRGWDLASSEEERVAEDPDYTAGIRLGVRWLPTDLDDEQMPEVYIDDFRLGKWAAPDRNKIIKATALADGPIPVGIESYGGYKDAATTLEAVLKGVRTVHRVHLPGDKVTRAGALEPAFDAGRVHMRRAEWNEKLLKFLREFPGAAHDDPIDAMVTAFAVHKPFVRRVWPMMHRARAAKFKVDWSHAQERHSMHYVGLYQDSDLVLYVVATLWDDVAGILYVYDAWDQEVVDPAATVTLLAARQHLQRYRVDGLLGSEDMLAKDGHIRSVGSVLNAELRRHKYKQRVRAPVRYDEYGSIAFVAQLLTRIPCALYIHSTAQVFEQQVRDWSIVNGKPETEHVGYCRALCHVVNELRRKVVAKRKPRRRDYQRVHVAGERTV